MRVEDFQKLSDAEIRQRANDCLAIVDDPRALLLHAPKLLEAQIYMDELRRRDGETVAVRDERMAKRSYILEIVVIILIGLEIVIGVGGIIFGVIEANRQAQIFTTQGFLLDTINANTAKTVDAIGKLQKAQDDSLQNSKNTLQANRTMVGTLTTQLSILKGEQDARIEAQNRHAQLELNTGTWDGVGFRLTRLEPGKGAPETGMHVSRTMNTNQITVRFFLRNVGNAPATNVTATPRTPPMVPVDCVEFMGLELANNGYEYKPCADQFGIIPPMYPRARDGGLTPEPRYDREHDVGIAVVLTAPPEINSFDLELTIRGDQMTPLQYRVQCHTF
jgi:hypothetical protein